MKKITNSIVLRTGTAIALSIIFITYPQLRVSAGGTAYAPLDLKSESQYKSEASSYDSAVRAIAGLETIKLETPDDLKQASSIVARERDKLRLLFSKLVAMGLLDTTFSNAVKKRATSQQSAEAFANELNADPKAVLKVDGAESLSSRIQKRVGDDAAMFRRVGERLKAAADKIKKTGQARTAMRFGATDRRGLVWASLNVAEASLGVSHTRWVTLDVGVAILLGVVAMGVSALFLYLMYTGAKGLAGRLGFAEPVDRFEDCQKRAQDKLNSCIAQANAQPFPLNIAAVAACDGQWLLDSGACLLS